MLAAEEKDDVTRVAMAVIVPLCFLDDVDHICHRLDVFLFIGWDLLHAFSIPADIIPVSQLRLIVDAAVVDIHY